MTPIAILGSGRGSNCHAIANAIAQHQLDATIVLVVADAPDAGILQVAHSHHLPTHVLPPGPYRTRLTTDQETALALQLQSAGAQWIVLAGWMRVVKAPLLTAFPDRIVNIHPSLLPKYRGLQAWKQAFDTGDPIAGCTVHLVDAGVDTGTILGQATVPRLPDDTPESLHARIQQAEHTLYPQTLAQLFTSTNSKTPPPRLHHASSPLPDLPRR